MDGCRLDDEQRARVRDCLCKEQIKLPLGQFGRLVSDIEASIDLFRAVPPEGTSREMHDALRTLWKLSHEGDPPIGQLRARLQKLPTRAREYVGRRARVVLPRLFPDDTIDIEPYALPEVACGQFLDWTVTADSPKLVTALRVLTADGAGIVAGRSRGDGKRSRPRIEPTIAGTARGGAGPKDRGGRPGETARRDLVMHLALDWLHATGSEPGRSEGTGFGELVHSVFQWLNLSEDPREAAIYALRRHWDEISRARAVSLLRDFLERHRECLDCKWYENRFEEGRVGFFCGQLNLPYRDARKPDAACGPEGILFELDWPEG